MVAHELWCVEIVVVKCCICYLSAHKSDRVEISNPDLCKNNFMIFMMCHDIYSRHGIIIIIETDVCPVS